MAMPERFTRWIENVRDFVGTGLICFGASAFSGDINVKAAEAHRTIEAWKFVELRQGEGK